MYTCAGHTWDISLPNYIFRFNCMNGKNLGKLVKGPAQYLEEDGCM